MESYTLQSSTDGTTWTDYKENGQVKVVEVKGCIIILMAWPITLKTRNAFFESFFAFSYHPTYCKTGLAASKNLIDSGIMLTGPFLLDSFNPW